MITMVRNESMFEYNLSRPYPFGWFTPVAIVGGIIAMVLVSFLNLAATGYELVTISSTDPNITISQHMPWFSNWPTWLASTRASCEATSMPLQTGLYTNKTALLYTLVSAWRYDKLGNQMNLGSLLYYNNPMSNCNVSSIQVDIESSDRTASQVAVSHVGAELTATVVCLLDRPEGPTHIELVTTYDPIPPLSLTTSIFLDVNATNKASLYWGHSALRLYWTDVMMKYFEDNVHLEQPSSKTTVTLTRLHGSLPATADNLKDMDFLRASACWLMPLNSTGIQYNDKFCDSNTLSVLAKGTTQQKPVPSVWQPMSVLGKAMWFAVLADLGRDDDFMPNILSHPDLLESLTANMSVVNETIPPTWRWGLSSSETSLAPFVTTQSATNNTELQIHPSVLATNYVCQIPSLKSTGTLIVSILVADLVLLQAIWKIFNLAVDYFFISKKAELRYCEGCARHVLRQTEIPLGDVNPQRESDIGYDEYLSVGGEVVTPSPSPSHRLLDHSHGN